MNVGQVVTIGTPIAVAALATLGAVWGKRLSKRTEDASVRKTNAEAVSIEVATARGLVEEVKKLMADQRVEYESRLAATRAEVATLTERVKGFDLRQRVLYAALAAHAPWDEAAFAALRTTTPTFPPPPSITPRIAGDLDE